MANDTLYPKVPLRRGIRDWPEYVLAVIRRPLAAYILIAFSISFAFYMVERHADERIVQATRSSCYRGNDLRRESNKRMAIFRRAAITTDDNRDSTLSKQLDGLKLITLIDCKKAVPDR